MIPVTLVHLWVFFCLLGMVYCLTMAVYNDHARAFRNIVSTVLLTAVAMLLGAMWQVLP